MRLSSTVVKVTFCAEAGKLVCLASANPRWQPCSSRPRSAPFYAPSILTPKPRVSSLVIMRFAGRVIVSVLTVALAGYALDCVGMTTPEQAMLCCNSMRCPSHGHHGQECCKSMPSVHAALGQPSSMQGVSFSPITLGTVQAFHESETCASSCRVIAEEAHAPPSLDSPAPLPLRV